MALKATIYKAELQIADMDRDMDAGIGQLLHRHDVMQVERGDRAPAKGAITNEPGHELAPDHAGGAGYQNTHQSFLRS